MRKAFELVEVKAREEFSRIQNTKPGMQYLIVLRKNWRSKYIIDFYVISKLICVFIVVILLLSSHSVLSLVVTSYCCVSAHVFSISYNLINADWISLHLSLSSRQNKKANTHWCDGVDKMLHQYCTTRKCYGKIVYIRLVEDSQDNLLK